MYPNRLSSIGKRFKTRLLVFRTRRNDRLDMTHYHNS